MTVVSNVLTLGFVYFGIFPQRYFWIKVKKRPSRARWPDEVFVPGFSASASRWLGGLAG